MEVLHLDILVAIIVTSFVQSMFGMGVLLFGTPILLLLNYPFLDTLSVLLPISATINTLQVYKDYNYIDKKIYFNVLVFTVPFIVFFLIFISKIEYNISAFIAVLLLFIALKDYSLVLSKILDKLMSYEKLYFIVMGIVHGITNLGGSLLSAKVFQTTLTKYEKRATIAISYLTFAVFQILTLLFLDVKYHLVSIIYIAVGMAVYTVINKFFFHNITTKRYDKLFAVFLFISAIALFFK